MDGGSSIARDTRLGSGGPPVPCLMPRSRSTASKVTRLRSEPLTDGELVTLALNGLEPAFGRLLDRHSRHLLRLVSGRLRNREDVLEVVQNTRLAVWRALHRYDAGRPFEAWLTSIALNKCTDWSRHRRAESTLRARMQADADACAGTAHAASAESVAIAEEQTRRLLRALARLPAPLRDPLLLTCLGNLRQSEAARELGLTRKAVEMRLRRARQQLERDGSA